MSAAPTASRDGPPSGGQGPSDPAAIRSPVVEWGLAPAESASVDRVAAETGLPRVMALLLVLRGVGSGGEARSFLRPERGELHDPSLLAGARAAADLLLSTARRGKRVVVFGDYDVDGVTAVAQLRAALRRAGTEAAAFIPHRLRDGYGLKPDTVRRVIAELDPATIVTVDCGITAVEGVACAKAAGVDVVVTDHHLVPDQLPAGAVVVNPKQPGCPYPYKELAASAIAMKISELLARLAGAALSRESLLRAACLGTIADLVPLTGENRTIAARGLVALAGSRTPGLRALLAEAGLRPGEAPSSEEVAFRLAPRLNAAGRLDTAHLALSLLEERDASRAAGIARELSARNAERQGIERHVVAQVRERLGRDPGAAGAAAIIEGDASWHRGVLGIAASRLAREYHRPVLLFGMDGGKASGSGRSIPGVSLHGILKELAGHFLDFGGHEQAVGASLAAARFEAFRSEARALFAERVPAEALVRRERADAELALEEIEEDLVRELAGLEPHGAGNPRPVFLARSVRATGPFGPVGANGLGGWLFAGAGRIRSVAWQPDAGLAAMAASGSPFDVHYRIAGGRRSYGPAVEIVAARPTAEDAP